MPETDEEKSENNENEELEEKSTNEEERASKDLPPVTFEEQPDGSWIIDFDLKLEAILSGIAALCFIMLLPLSLTWLFDDMPLWILGVAVLITVSVTLFSSKINQYYIVSHDTDEFLYAQNIFSAISKQRIGKLSDALFCAIETQFVSNNDTPVWRHRLALVFNNGVVVPVSEYANDPSVLEELLLRLEDITGVPHKDLPLDAETVYNLKDNKEGISITTRSAQTSGRNSLWSQYLFCMCIVFFTILIGALFS